MGLFGQARSLLQAGGPATGATLPQQGGWTDFQQSLGAPIRGGSPAAPVGGIAAPERAPDPNVAALRALAVPAIAYWRTQGVTINPNAGNNQDTWLTQTNAMRTALGTTTPLNQQQGQFFYQQHLAYSQAQREFLIANRNVRGQEFLRRYGEFQERQAGIINGRIDTFNEANPSNQITARVVVNRGRYGGNLGIEDPAASGGGGNGFLPRQARLVREGAPS